MGVGQFAPVRALSARSPPERSGPLTGFINAAMAMVKLSQDKTPESQTQFHPSFILEPIRTMDSGFFHSHGIKEISRIVLLQLAFVVQNGFHHLHVIAADDLLLCLRSFGPESFPIPRHAILTRALFSFHFSCQPRPRTAEIILPNTLKLEEPADAPLISAWFARAGFSFAQNIRHCVISRGHEAPFQLKPLGRSPLRISDLGSRISGFGLLSDFGFRPSDFASRRGPIPRPLLTW